jgi:hypothetical protein
MRSSTTGGALLLAAVALMPAAPTTASSSTNIDSSSAAGCMSNAAYGQLSVGLRLAHVRRVADDGAQISMRRWTSGINAYQERLYRLCTPTDSAHGVLTVRFMRFQGAWRSQIVDTMVGPEPN